jgi:hypothetical protein
MSPDEATEIAPRVFVVVEVARVDLDRHPRRCIGRARRPCMPAVSDCPQPADDHSVLTACCRGEPLDPIGPVRKPDGGSRLQLSVSAESASSEPDHSRLAFVENVYAESEAKRTTATAVVARVDRPDLRENGDERPRGAPICGGVGVGSREGGRGDNARGQRKENGSLLHPQKYGQGTGKGPVLRGPVFRSEP